MKVDWELMMDGLGRLEAPCFDGQGRLCFADMRPPGAVYRLDDDGSVTKLADREHVGGLVAHAQGGLLASGHDVAVLQEDGGVRVVLEPGDGWGFNDLATDASGNVFVGMHGERPTGQAPSVTATLWRIGAGGQVSRCYDGIALTNGLGFSPDGSRLYHNDTVAGTVWVSDVGDDGLPTNRRAHYVLDGGSPDGLAIDEDGCVWVTAMGAGRIIRVTPEGKEDAVLQTPSRWAASVCFGGADGRDLYLATFGGEPYDSNRSGAVYRTRVDHPGAPVAPATV